MFQDKTVAKIVSHPSFEYKRVWNDVAILLEAKHLCVAARGVEDILSTTITTGYSGEFKKEEVQSKFLKYIGSDFTKESGQ